MSHAATDPQSLTEQRAALALAHCSASGPRLRCIERSPRLFYGKYKGHEVGVERDHKGRWCYLVICPDGSRAADGITSEPCSQREAIIHALRGAMLWPNTKVTHGRAQP